MYVCGLLANSVFVKVQIATIFFLLGNSFCILILHGSVFVTVMYPIYEHEKLFRVQLFLET